MTTEEQNRTEMSDEQKQAKIKGLQEERVKLLDRYGIFGGGEFVDRLHQQINKQLEDLGVDPNS